MPTNDPCFYERIYTKLLGCEHIPKSKREGMFDTNDHPIYCYRMYNNPRLFYEVNKVMRKSDRTVGRYKRNEGKIVLTVIRPQGNTREDAIVCMRLKDYRDLHVGRAGEVERESSPAGFLEWLRPDVWAEIEDVSPTDDAWQDDNGA